MVPYQSHPILWCNALLGVRRMRLRALAFKVAIEQDQRFDGLPLQPWVFTSRPVHRHSGIPFIHQCQAMNAPLLAGQGTR